MLAWTDPKRTLDSRRLSESSAGPDDSHGASSAHRTQRIAR